MELNAQVHNKISFHSIRECYSYFKLNLDYYITNDHILNIETVSCKYYLATYMLKIF